MTNANINTVHFSSVHYVPENHRSNRDLCLGTKRSAWQSEEHVRSPKLHDKITLPPRRPSRDRKFLNKLPDDLFVNSDKGPDGERERSGRRERRSIRRKSILKNRKYNNITTPTPTEIYRPGSPMSVSSFESNETAEKNTSSLTRSRNSVLDLLKMAIEIDKRSLAFFDDQ